MFIFARKRPKKNPLHASGIKNTPKLPGVFLFDGTLYFNVRMKATACQICSSVNTPFHATMEVPSLPVLMRQYR